MKISDDADVEDMSFPYVVEVLASWEVFWLIGGKV